MYTPPKLPDSGNSQLLSASGNTTAEASAQTLRDLKNRDSQNLGQNLGEDVADLVTHTTSLSKADLTRIKARLSDTVASAKASMTEISDDVARRVRSSAKATDEYVHQQPWKAVGVVAFAGLLIGLLVGRRK